MEENKKIEKLNSDNHVSPVVTHWVHRHRTLAIWLVRALIMALTAFVYFLKNQKKVIEEEEESGPKN